MAAGCSEIGNQPLGRPLLDVPVVLFRKEDGGVVAMRDACPHRGYPLSKSQVTGNGIQCRYPGMTFNEHERCTDIPSAPGMPIAEAMRVTAYPVIEKWHWVWIWMGDPDKADPAQIPQFECEGYAHYEHRFYSPMGPSLGNFQLLHDNLCDVTHTSYLHAGLLDDPDNTEMAVSEPNVERVNERTLRVWRDMRNFVPNEEVARLYHRQAGMRYNRRLEVWHHFPHAVTAFNRYYSHTDSFDLEHTGELMVEYITALGITPASANTSYHFTAVSSSFAQTDADSDGLLYVIGQDIEAFADLQRYFEQHVHDAVEVSVPSNRLGMLSRRIIADMVRAEEAQQRADA